MNSATKVTWGYAKEGGDSRAVQDRLRKDWVAWAEETW